MTDNFRLQVLEDALREIAQLSETAMNRPLATGCWQCLYEIGETASHALDAVSEAPDGTPLGLLSDRENARGRAEEMS